MRSARRTARGRDVRAAALAVLVLLGASVPGCLLPELIVDGSGGTGGSGSDELGGANSGGGSSTDSGGGSNGGTNTGGGSSSGGATGGGADSGGGSPGGGGDSGGTAAGGDGSGAASSGGNGSGGAPVLTSYYESGDWHGFVAPFVTGYGTLDQDDFEDTTDAPYCLSGNLPSVDFSNVAGWRWNLDQDPTCAGDACVPPVSTVTPASDGITLGLDNRLGTYLHLDIEGPNAAEDPSDRWCVSLGAADGLLFVPWSAFRGDCLAGGEGAVYANQSITTLEVWVQDNGYDQPDVPFDYCVEYVEEAAGPEPGCSDTDGPGTGSYELTGDRSSGVLRGARPYGVTGDLWAGQDGTHVIEGTGTAFEVTTTAPSSSEVFPAVFVGEIDSKKSLTPGMPRSVASTNPLLIAWDWSGAIQTSVAALELRFSTATDGIGVPSSYMEIWVEAGSGIVPLGTSQGTVSVDSTTWNVYQGTVNSRPIVTFRAATPLGSFQADLQDFIDVAATNGWVTGSYVTSVAAGFELFGGTGADLSSTDLCIAP